MAARPTLLLLINCLAVSRHPLTEGPSRHRPWRETKTPLSLAGYGIIYGETVSVVAMMYQPVVAMMYQWLQ